MGLDVGLDDVTLLGEICREGRATVTGGGHGLAVEDVLRGGAVFLVAEELEIGLALHRVGDEDPSFVHEARIRRGGRQRRNSRRIRG